MTGNATPIRQTARLWGGGVSQRQGHPAAAPRQLVLANHRANLDPPPREPIASSRSPRLDATGVT
jgi:hypothetical protein